MPPQANGIRLRLRGWPRCRRRLESQALTLPRQLRPVSMERCQRFGHQQRGGNQQRCPHHHSGRPFGLLLLLCAQQQLLLLHHMLLLPLQQRLLH